MGDAPECKTRQVLVGEEWETPVFLLAVKRGMFSIFWFVRESILFQRKKMSHKRNRLEFVTEDAAQTSQSYCS